MIERFRSRDDVCDPGNLGGFTLIELLIVVAIIAILAAIALPNFLEAQTRARVSRMKGDLYTLALGLDSYRLDSRAYPYSRFLYYRDRLRPLTTPISYLAQIPTDIFNPGLDVLSVNENNVLAYGERDAGYDLTVYAQLAGKDPNLVQWIAFSYGPMRNATDYPLYRSHISERGIEVRGYVDVAYDPTNGTVSGGIIARVGP